MSSVVRTGGVGLLPGLNAGEICGGSGSGSGLGFGRFGFRRSRTRRRRCRRLAAGAAEPAQLRERRGRRFCRDGRSRRLRCRRRFRVTGGGATAAGAARTMFAGSPKHPGPRREAMPPKLLCASSFKLSVWRAAKVTSAARERSCCRAGQFNAERGPVPGFRMKIDGAIM